jgi:anti-sigma-K factor RskA
MSGHDDLKLSLGSYALGNLEASERAQVRLHLRTCAECREELARLRGAAELMPLTREVVASEEPSALLGRRVLARRARRSWLTVALPSAAVGALVAVAAVALWPEGGATTVAMTRPGTHDWAHAEIYASGRIKLDGDLPPTRGSQVYELWFMRRTGRVSAGTFRVGARGRMHLTLNTAARPEAFGQIGITREPDDLDPACNGPGVVAADL